MNAPTLKILSLLPVLGHPRDSKRIAMLQAAGFELRVAAFERDYHNGRMPSCPVDSLGRIQHGQYLARAVKMLRALPALRRMLRATDVVWASGPDMALFGILAGFGLGKPVILEVGDIRRVQVCGGWKGWIGRALDRFIVRRSSLLVVTARGFAQEYYERRLGSRIPVLLMENKLDEAPLRAALKGSVPSPVAPLDQSRRPLRIGYFGVLRCPWSWQVLKHVAQAMPDTVHVSLAGYCMDPPDLAEQARGVANVEYLGTYRSPEDLPRLYGSVDIVWACYPGPEVTDPAWRWALSVCRSNRFYESCFFQRPLVSMAESGDGAEVRRMDVGLLLTDQSEEGVLRAIQGIRPEDLARWAANLQQLPLGVGVYTDEVQQLQSAIRRICGMPGNPDRRPRSGQEHQAGEVR
ncbi:MAG: hypothetical protein LW625_00600 [Planctomycetaceae bacterium]|nr:hypothetical protein [Planctomycetaceae bacterium]